MLKILFYLPLARSWMLENVIDPMIAKLSAVSDVHVIIGSAWMERYYRRRGMPSFEWCRDVKWHPIDDCRDMNASGIARPSQNCLDVARTIDPDYCLCRSANASLSEYMPGKVSFIMEASAPPFFVPKHWITLQPQIFDHAFIPKLSVAERNTLRSLISSAWIRMERTHTYQASWRSLNGLPLNRKIIALPLEYDHPDNLFSVYRSIRPNHRFVTELAARISAPLFLAVTDHPLNEDFVDNRELLKSIEQYKHIACLLSSNGSSGNATLHLMRHADGMIVGDSKAFAVAAFFGKPILRLSKFDSGPWLNVYQDFDQFTTALISNKCSVANRDDAIVWFAFYLANQAFAPGDANVEGDEILSRIEMPIDARRWRVAFERYETGIAA